jgi:hypothetical protein
MAIAPTPPRHTRCTEGATFKVSEVREIFPPDYK